MRSGATQWRLICEHKADRPVDRAMHSQVSENNVRFFPKENRVTDDVTQGDLEAWLEQAEARDGTLVSCNQCRRIKILDDDGLEVVHEGGVRA